MIRHIVFDLWGTLIKSPLGFKEERAHKIWSILQNTNPDLHLTTVTEAFRKYELYLDKLAESRRVQFDNHTVWYNFFQHLNVKFNRNVVQTCIDEVNALFLSMPAEFYDEHTYMVLNRIYKHSMNLNSNQDHKVFMSVISNTNFTNGKIVDRYLKKLEIYHMFQYRTYSDIVLVPKPSPAIFQLHRNRLLLNPETTVMVGDNPKTDGGAVPHYRKFIYINGNSGNNINNITNLLIFP